MILDYEPGDRVINPNKKDWGIGQVQSIIDFKVTINFENAGKKVINAKPKIKIKKISQSISHIDANNSIGFVAADTGIQKAIDNAK